MNNISAVLVLCCIFLTTFMFDRASKRRRLLATVPPCYTAIPFLGNLFNIPTNKSWETYTAWGRELNSELISMWAPGGQLTIIINSAKAARELLSHRSSNYGDRPRLPVLDLAGQVDRVTSLMPYGERWRAHRRLLHRKFNLTAVSAYEPAQDEQMKLFLQDLYLEPGKVRAHVEHFTASLALTIAYGYRISKGRDEIGNMVHKGLEMIVNSILPGAFAVNTFPALRHLPEWLPGTSFHGFARKCEHLMKRVREEPYNKVKALASLGQAPPSFTKTILDKIDSPSPLEESIIQEVASMVYIAGAETSLSAIRTIILALVLNPDVQRRAQAELDAVVGRDRLPVHGDKYRLPYIEAIIRETLRWRPVIPLVPRRTIKDDVYGNMFIPAGTTLAWNSWAITHDPDVYLEPHVFRPERYLDSRGKLALDEDRSIFGYGRRECVGMHLARSTLFLVTASILSVFDLSKAKDEDGNEIQIQIDYTDGAVSHPKDFDCSIRPRDEQAVKLLDMIKSSSH